jgi:uncharacterized protein YvpB
MSKVVARIALTGMLGLSVAASACDGGSHVQSSLRPAGTATRPPSTATQRGVPHVTRTAALPTRVVLSAPEIRQLPELPNGCEVTSLAMLLAAVHRPVPKLELARRLPTDPTPPTFSGDGSGFYSVARWGDPNRGFVGSVYGDGIGYAIYHGPLTRFLAQLMPGRAVDLTGHSFDDVLTHVAHGVPVVMWVTTTFAPTDDWVTWQAHGSRVRGTTFEHAVLLVGYDKTSVYVNNPLNGEREQRVSRALFEAAWRQLGQQAVTVSIH